MAIKAGELNTTITFQQNTPTHDSLNQPVPNWADVATVYASVITTGGREYYAAQKLNAETSVVFKIRYRRGLKTTMRVKWAGKYYEILPPINDVNGKHEEILISAKEVT